jgi:UDP-N-acetylmuramyl tripeptide synthase
MALLHMAGQTGRIPVVAVIGVNGKTTVTRLVAHILRQDRRMVGMTCTDGIWMGDRRVDNGDCSGPRSAQAVLAHPHVQAAVVETARGGILRAGLGFDRCDVAIVTNIGQGDHLGLDGVDTLEKLALVKRTIVDVGSAGRNSSAKRERFTGGSDGSEVPWQSADVCPGRTTAGSGRSSRSWWSGHFCS